MDGLLPVTLAAVTLVGTHFLLSHPLRRPLVARLGETAFLILYIVIALAALGWLSSAWRKAPPSAPFWPVGDTLWAIVSLVMLAASVLLMGSLIRNPAMPGSQSAPEARGVFAVTRHPMMWSFALWAACHLAIYPVTKNLITAIAIIVLALVGAALQDGKKRALQPERWATWESRTSFWPFRAIAEGRARFGNFGMHTLLGGLVVWLAATWLHIPLSGWRAGIWRWIG